MSFLGEKETRPIPGSIQGGGFADTRRPLLEEQKPKHVNGSGETSARSRFYSLSI